MILAVWLLSLPFRLLAALGLRRSIILACLLVLGVTAYGVAEDLGLVEPPAHASPAPTPAAGQPTPSRAATADIPAGYLRLYQQAGARYRVPWPVLAAIGKVESDHGRARLPGVRSGLNRYRDRSGRRRRCCAGPMQFNLTDGPPSTWQRHGRGNVYDPADAIPAAARKLVADGARRNLDRALYAYNHSWAYVAKVKQLARRYASTVSRRIVIHLDRGLGWTAPRFVAGCGDCGTELARSTNQATAERTAGRARCPVCGTRAARRLPGTTSLAADLALARGPGRWPPARRPLRLRRTGRR